MSKPKYNIKIEINDKEYKGSGDTALEALKSIKLKTFKTRAVMTASKGDKEFVRMFNPFAIKRVFSPAVWPKIVMSKNIELMLK